MGGCGSTAKGVQPVANKVEVKQASQQPQDKQSSKPKKGSDNGLLVLDKPGQPDITVHYTMGKALGKGQFGVVRLVTHKETEKKYACKSLAKRQLKTKEDVDDVKKEIEILYHLKNHQNIVGLIDTFEDKQNVHLLLELAAGGELFDAIVAKGQYSEKDAADCIRTIVQVIGHCHTMGVAHRDLKPENFLLTSNDQNAQVKCTDFGLSAYFKPGEVMTDLVGSAFYVAPEVLDQKYGPQCDIWSAGVILYILLSGVPPFWGDTETQIFESIKHGHIDFDSAPWPKVSDQAKDVVRMMLEQDVSKRATAKDILLHDWVKEDGIADENPLDNEVLKRIKKFSAMNKLKKEALIVIAKNLPKEEIAGLKELFIAMDTDSSGTITIQELREGLKQQQTIIPDSDLVNIMDAADVDANGTIDYQEFLAATVHRASALKMEHIEQAFSHFDSDGSGYITLDELRQGLASQQYEESELQQMIAEVDTDQDGQINYQEFVNMMVSKLDSEDNISFHNRGRLHV